MKRSDMVKKIADYLFFNESDESSKGRADSLLTYLEYLGILPPEIDKMIEGHQCTLNEWETEDETK